ncbi:MAG: site-2 protease family protein [Candidatus Omnitrophota bacterium]|nr:MAG: site-2 protease family protein [Candidatus Omnitrophota bacterium]
MLLFLIPILLISITFHEYSHGWMASKLGDPTPRESGRLTFNPLAHIDPFGTVILPFLLLVVSQGAFAFGYAKPVPINPYHFKNPKKDIMWVGLSGPAANFLLALILIAFLKAGIMMFPKILNEAIILGIIINFILGTFNLIPIPPLDGSKIVASFLPYRISYKYLRMEMVGFLIMMILIMSGFFRWFISYFVFPVINMILSAFGINVVI